MNDKNYPSNTEPYDLEDANNSNIREGMKVCLANSLNMISTAEKLYKNLLFMKKTFLDESAPSYKRNDTYMNNRENYMNSISSEKERENCYLLSLLENKLANKLLEHFSSSSFSEKIETALADNNITELYNLMTSMNEYLNVTLTEYIRSVMDFQYLPNSNKDFPLYEFNEVTLLITKNAKPMAYYEPLTHSFIQLETPFDAFDIFFFDFYLRKILALHQTFQKIIEYHDALLEHSTIFFELLGYCEQ